MNNTINVKRVLLASHFYKPSIGGLETFTENLAREQKKRGIITWVVTARHDVKLPEEEEQDGVAVRRFLPSSSWSVKDHRNNNLIVILRSMAHINVLFKTWRFIARHGPQVINICYPVPSSAYLVILSLIYRIPVVVSLHGEITNSMPYACAAERLLMRLVLKRACYVTACSASLLEAAVKFAPGIRDRSGFIHNGISIDGYSLQEDRRNEDSRKGRYILTIANLWWYKGVDILLMAMQSIYGKGYDVGLVVAGNGAGASEIDKLRALSRLLRVDDKVVFKGRVNDEQKKELLRNCEFFVLPSRLEPFGIVNLEAMTFGKAIVATRSGGIPEIVKDGINGILVEPYDDKALADGIMRLLDDRELRATLGRNGRKMIEDPKFSWDNVTGKYMEVYDKAVAVG